MEFLTGFIQSTQQSVVDGAQELAEEKNIKQKIFNEAQEYAQLIANHIKNPDSKPPPEFPPLPLDTDNDLIEYYFVLDFLESIGLKFSPTIFRYETQRTNEFVDRAFIRDSLNLRSYDKTPLLVQLIEEIRKSQEK
ncbi:hypothetical protein TRFO_22268 [Tritrichomonas foetus]|uniref:LisH domain-containing protein n=1 Tax=Tritrichomonas foetus TaxID=1144522 RepID=A0A1J4KC70_9EUKA|nr:hypothetical protein TRFO_22268 [Tritrichomonas foetus]|eukprot:OHT09017.1 hypothetical protein TRFO_22268 [Tritrichomonas foetus]